MDDVTVLLDNKRSLLCFVGCDRREEKNSGGRFHDDDDANFVRG